MLLACLSAAAPASGSNDTIRHKNPRYYYTEWWGDCSEYQYMCVASPGVFALDAMEQYTPNTIILSGAVVMVKDVDWSQNYLINHYAPEYVSV